MINTSIGDCTVDGSESAKPAEALLIGKE
jgi:hypothetical protein